MKTRAIHLSPSQLLILVFFTAILLGTCLLKLPIASYHYVRWIDALFTATSAMTVTGLSTIDSAKEYTLFGQFVIITLIQLGGLGIVSFALLIFIMLGKKIGLKERILIQQSLNQTSLGGVIKLVRNLFLFSFMFEFIAMLFLSIRWIPEYGFWKGVFYSFFHSISAFNNAGFALWSDNLIRYVGDPIVNIGITGLIILGGIGFTVMSDIWYKKSFRKLSLHSKIMIIGTIVTNLLAMAFIFFLEYHNPHTLGHLSTPNKLWASYFQAVTTRTAGFETMDLNDLKEPTALLFLLLMFVGAGSASTGGGIKLTTFIVIVISVITFIKGKQEIVLAKRTIATSILLKSLAIFSIALLAIFLAVFVLCITEKAPFLKVLFEVISAFGTVGLTMGLTTKLTMIGKLIIVMMMFIGKLGPLTLAVSIAKSEQASIRYPHEDILTG
ncbi:Ktr system potassium transporter B [Heyndrickxia shackletonii]|uniref:Ktr system potassium transporter B n=1 Tax=Heyndrickxia shackletonii TaxID=157838 RepID=A0A0Q3TN01_9BACI|nr:TrkH family potassium uptake protein [Heyndrickxia shackletonii]KQL55382.1 Ktr system potassium transporter B [Heyndrickxia shackletonii]NEY98593.1 Ktr system potassium transporter B [Heyndrickxia shackletonii]